jgi:hypothetical protein
MGKELTPLNVELKETEQSERNHLEHPHPNPSTKTQGTKNY